MARHGEQAVGEFLERLHKDGQRSDSGPMLCNVGVEKTGIAIENALQQDQRTAEATRSAFAERSTGGYFLDFTVNRSAAARFGLNVGDVERVIMAAMGW